MPSDGETYTLGKLAVYFSFQKGQVDYLEPSRAQLCLGIGCAGWTIVRVCHGSHPTCRNSRIFPPWSKLLRVACCLTGRDDRLIVSLIVSTVGIPENCRGESCLVNRLNLRGVFQSKGGTEAPVAPARRRTATAGWLKEIASGKVRVDTRFNCEGMWLASIKRTGGIQEKAPAVVCRL